MSVHHMQAGAQRDREGAQFLERKLQAVVSPLIWMLGTEPRSSVRTVYSFNDRAMSPASSHSALKGINSQIILSPCCCSYRVLKSIPDKEISQKLQQALPSETLVK